MMGRNTRRSTRRGGCTHDMSSTSTFDVGQSAVNLSQPVASERPRPGGWVHRLDFFLSEPLRQAAPEELARCRVLIGIALGLMLLDGLVLLSLPYSASPRVHATVTLFSLVMNSLALVLLRRRARAELSAMVVCSAICVSFVFTCIESNSPYTAAHAAAMLLPALSVYLVGSRPGLVISVMLSGFVGLIHPLLFTAPRYLPPPGFTPIRLADLFAATCIMGIWAVSSLHSTARDQAQAAREQALRTLRESEHKLQSLIENTDDQVCSLDIEGRLIVANSAMRRAYLQRFGHEPKPGDFLMPDPQDQAGLRQNIQESFRAQGVRLEDSHTWQGRTDVVDLSFKPIFDAEGRRQGVTIFGRDITERKEAETKLGEMHRTLMDVSRQAGMAEVATGLLHNVGNTLNSVNVSANLVIDRLRGSRVAGLVRVAQLLGEHPSDMGAFLTTDPRGQRLPAYLIALSAQLVEEQQALLAEQRTLTEGLDHVKAIVSMQQGHARLSALVEQLSVPRLIDDALRLHALSFERAGIEISREYAQVPPILVDRHKLLQILLNLLGNARHALLDSGRSDKRVTIRVGPAAHARLHIQVSDNGKGIQPEHLKRMFTQGFTTKKEGHGFGLHISALAAIEMQGRLACDSPGPGLGATFTIDLPMRDKESTNSV